MDDHCEPSDNVAGDTLSVVTIFEHLGKELSMDSDKNDQSEVTLPGEDQQLFLCSSYSNSSGYETESESREYFVARDVKNVLQT